MRLTDLNPRWVNEDIFVFKSPVGRKYWMICKRVAMCPLDQIDLARSVYPDLEELNIVPGREAYCWKFEGNDFNTMTVEPSLDGSASGNWHGFITNGEIVGGLCN